MASSSRASPPHTLHMDPNRGHRSALTLHALEFSKNPDVFVIPGHNGVAGRSGEEENEHGQQEVDARQSASRAATGEGGPEEDGEDAGLEGGGDGAGDQATTEHAEELRAANRAIVEARPKWRRQAPTLVRLLGTSRQSLQYHHETIILSRMDRTRPAFTVADWDITMAELQLEEETTKGAALQELNRYVRGPSGALGLPLEVHLVQEPTRFADEAAARPDASTLIQLGFRIPIFIEEDQGTCSIKDIVEAWRSNSGPLLEPQQSLWVYDSGMEKDRADQENTSEPWALVGVVHTLRTPRPSDFGELYTAFVTKSRQEAGALTYSNFINDFYAWEIPDALRKQSLKRLIWGRRQRNSEWRPRQYGELAMSGAYNRARRTAAGYVTCAVVVGGDEGGRKVWEIPVGDLAAMTNTFSLGGYNGFGGLQEWASVELSSGEGVLVLPPGQVYATRALTDTLTILYYDWTPSTFYLTLEALREELFVAKPPTQTSSSEWNDLEAIIAMLDNDRVFTYDMRRRICHSGKRLVDAYMAREELSDDDMASHAHDIPSGIALTIITRLWIWLQKYLGGQYQDIQRRLQNASN